MISKILYIGTKLTGLSEQEFKEKYMDGDEIKDDAFDAMIESTSAKLEKRGQEMFDKGFQKAEGKYKGVAEKKFKELTGVEADDSATIEDMIETFKESNKSKSKHTDDDIKVHPVYRELEKNSVKKAEYEALRTEFDSYKASEEKNKVLGNVKPKVWDVVSKMNPVLEANTKVAETRKNTFINAVISGVEIVADGDDIVLMKDGKRLEDKLGNPVSFDSYVKGEAENYFEFKKQEPKGGAGNGNNPPDPEGQFTAPKTIEEFNAKRAEMKGEDLVKYSRFGAEALKQQGIEI